jgi:curved DNA-binding protein CbpA
VSQLKDHYKTLQVDPEADADVITAAYRALARRLHPDKDYTGIDEYRMSELNRAHAVLRDPAKRREYDAERTLMRPMGPGRGAAEDDLSVNAAVPRTGGLAARWMAHEDAKGRGVAPSTRARTATALTADDEPVRLPFGRYAGMTLREIAAADTDYLRWLGRHSSGLRFRRDIERILKTSL